MLTTPGGADTFAFAAQATISVQLHACPDRAGLPDEDRRWHAHLLFKAN
jgi:hypothetical protein